MILRRYCVTVMDNWTPTRSFWTLRGATRWFHAMGPTSYIWQWNGKEWARLSGGEQP